jgi:hypothetical protein
MMAPSMATGALTVAPQSPTAPTMAGAVGPARPIAYGRLATIARNRTVGLSILAA